MSANINEKGKGKSLLFQRIKQAQSRTFVLSQSSVLFCIIIVYRHVFAAGNTMAWRKKKKKDNEVNKIVQKRRNQEWAPSTIAEKSRIVTLRR